MAINVDTSKVDAAASRIASNNTKIRNDFSAVASAINDLNRVWDGKASNNAIYVFNGIRDNFRDARYDVTNQLVSFLRKQISDNYEVAENKVHSAAKEFK